MLLAGLVPSLSPRARLISVVRHPAIAAATLSESQMTDRPLRESITWVRLHYERFLQRARIPGEIVVRFEDVLNDPAGTLSAIASALGLDVVEAWIATAEEGICRPPRLRRFDRTVAAEAHRHLACLASELGYRGPPC
jgi:hypothetical protein